MEKPRVIHIKDSTGSKDEVYIGRAKAGHDGYFGNPIAKGRQCPVCHETHLSPGDTLPCYKKWLWQRLLADSEFAAKVMDLAGKTLVCFCHPNPCHGNILAAACEWLWQQRERRTS